MFASLRRDDLPPYPIGGEAWSDQALADLQVMPKETREAWLAIFEHGVKASGTPNKKWLMLSQNMLDGLGQNEFMNRILSWFPLVNKPRTRPLYDRKIPDNAPQYLIDMIKKAQESQVFSMHPHNVDILKGLACFASLIDHRDVARALTALALSAYKKIPGIGARAVKVGNACLFALGALPGTGGVDQLAILKVKVRGRSAINGIEKALNAAAQRLGITASELEEIGIPSYGMEAVGVLREEMGDFIADARITGTHSMELYWEKKDGKRQKSVPTVVSEQFAEDVKEFKATMKDIQKMLPAQRDRLDRLLITKRTWPYKTWRERYIDHPLLGYIAQRLIWVFTTGKEAEAGAYSDGDLVDVDGHKLVGIGEGTTVALWHPIDDDAEAVLAWREWLEKHEVQQPFKQAHREIYILTDAERATTTYSNRYAAHIIKQHQYRSLAEIRRWICKLKLVYDDMKESNASISLPEWKLRAEFWSAGVGEFDNRDYVNETGTYLYLSTDQVRFFNLGGDQNPVPLERIPPLVFSEVMRDVDLFIGVASVGNDPNWQDGGPGGRYRNYWTSFSFGELGETAKTRKEILKRVIPRLKIRDRCSFSDKFLVVEGDLRTYKIHIGSANILMTPNDQYLCIVPKQGGHAAEREENEVAREGWKPGKPGVDVFLPFEGDNMLTIIISKALLLAGDSKITDSWILSQIKRK